MGAVGPVLLCRCAAGAVCAAAWVCALWRVSAGEGGPLEATVAAGVWGLSLLPVHVATGSGERRTATGERCARGAPGGGVRGARARGPAEHWSPERRSSARWKSVGGPAEPGRAATRAWRLRRWGGGSGR